MNGLLIGRFQPFHLGHLEALQFALSKVDKIARTYDNCKILYFHTKGVSNKYKDLISNKFSHV